MNKIRLPFHFSSFQLLLLCLVINFFLNFPTLSVQHGFSPGDAGINLYAVDAVVKGKIPYQDFYWQYGPLMLYYNALFFKLLGAQIQSLIWGRVILKTLFSGVFFMAARRIMPPWASLLAALAFGVFTPDFMHNFSHYGGICMEVGVLWAMLSYSQSDQEKYIWWAALFVLLLGFIKINFGVVMLAGAGINLILWDVLKYKKFSIRQLAVYGYLLIGIILVWVFIHFLFLKNLSIHEIKQSFPFFKGYSTCYVNRSIPDGFISIFNTAIFNIRQNGRDAVIAGLALIAFIRVVISIVLQKSWTGPRHRDYFLIIITMLILAVLSYHEFIMGGIDYEAYWVKPFTIMILAYLITEASVISGPFLRRTVFILVAGIIGFQAWQNWKFLERYKDKAYFFAHRGMNIYVIEATKDIKSMVDTENYIEQNIPQDKLFFVFPSDALYYFLSGHPAPSRLLYMFKAINITPAQEIDLIRSLERQKVEYIIQGSVCYAGFGQWGKFGRDYGLIFDKYIKEYYQEVARFGEWSPNPEDYIGGMGTRIFKKKDSQILNITSPEDLN